MDENFAAWIRDARLQLFLSQKELAEELKLARSTIVGWEKGVVPTSDNFRKAIKYFNTDARGYREKSAALVNTQVVKRSYPGQDLTTILVSSVCSPEFDRFLSAYHEAFDESERASSAEIIAWLGEKGSRYDIEYNCLLVEKDEVPVSIAIVWHCLKRELSYISFLGLTKQAEKWHMARSAVTSLLYKSKGLYGICRYHVMEFDDPSEEGIGEKEKTRRTARLRRFQSLAGACGLKLSYVDINFIMPSYHTDALDYTSTRMVLALLHEGDCRDSLPKSEVVEILRFLLFDVYLPCLNGNNNVIVKYEDQLKSTMSDYEQSLPLEVPIRRL